MAVEISVGGLSAYADYVLSIGNQVMVASIFDRSSVKIKAVGVKIGKAPICFKKSYRERRVATQGNYKVAVTDVRNNRDRFYSCLCISEKLSDICLITTEETLYEDFYNFLMKKFSLPLLKEWIPYLYERSTNDRLVRKEYKSDFLVIGDEERTIPLNGKSVKLGSLIGLSVSLNEEKVEEYISEGLRSGKIKISDVPSKPLEFKDFNEYIASYGKTLVENLEKEITPIIPLKPSVDSLALYNMRLYPQQAAAVNGIIALRKKGSKYALLNEGMGVGKTIQALSVVEGYFNSVYMEKNGCDLKTTIESGAVSYRIPIMCPGHLVEKWAKTIRDEIPQAKVTIVDDLSKFIALRNHGPKRDGKEFFVFSKDFAKLSSLQEPIPTETATKPAHIKVCKGCRENGVRTVQKGYGQTKCPECGSTEWAKEKVAYTPFYGMVCPHCGELLIQASIEGKEEKTTEELADKVLTPASFANKTGANAICYHCGEQLWGVNTKPLTQGSGKEEFLSLQSRPKKWRKISHYKNFSRKNKETAYVLVKWEKNVVNSETGELETKMDMAGINDYLTKVNVPDGKYEFSKMEYGPRKYAPAAFIKKYLKGYFDMCILDECHQYEGNGSAQATAAHALIKASEFTLGLTGTLLNGKANSIFSLLYMLDPKRMKDKGFDRSDEMAFSKRYGCVETVREATDDDENVRYRSSSRGKQIGTPRVKPGISPLVYPEFLLDKAVFLDLSDLSKYLPPLKEYVRIVPIEEDIKEGYDITIKLLKDSLKKPEGKKMMSYILNFGLSYPDKPYGRKPIMSITMNDTLIANPINVERCETELLNKEKELIEIINEQRDRGRNAFVYCSYTGDPEYNVTHRLKDIIEKHCNLRGRVQIIDSNKPQATEREAWLHQKAAEGMQVFICNPKVVETGLDFCWEHENVRYNYPTLVFYQMSYELATMWQASRRAFRLNQREECENYYLCYEGTLQQAAVEIMAEKQVATSAIQGKFSAEGLASMANGVDGRVKLAQALAAGDTGDRKSLENMFDVLNTNINASEEDGGIVSLTYEEVMGYARTESVVEEKPVIKPVVESTTTDNFDFDSIFGGQISLFDLFDEVTEPVKEETKEEVKKPKKAKVSKIQEGQVSLFDLAM